MCSTSKVNELLGAGATAASTTAAVNCPVISAVKFRHGRQKYYLIDIREADEIAADPLDESGTLTADVEVPMGKLLAQGVAEDWINQDAIVLVCSTGYRSRIAAQELATRSSNHNNKKVVALQQGLVGLRNPAATVPDFVVVLGTKSCAEKITLALNACAVAASQGGETVVLALLGDGICAFLRKGNNKELESPTSLRVEETYIGEPFQPCHALLAKFIGSGNGVVLGCTSCAKSRGVEFGSDLLDCVSPMQMPDLLRMLGEAKKSMQFM